MAFLSYLAKSIIYIASAAIVFPVVTYSQTGPAGVGSSTNNRYWLDAHSLEGYSEGEIVQTWPDLSGNGDDFSQFSVHRSPTYTSTGIGGLPSLEFDGSNDVLVADPNASMETDAVTYYLVYDREGTAHSMIINGDYDSDFRKWRTYSNNGSDRMYSVHFSPSINFVFYDDLGTGSFFSSHYSSAGVRTYFEGNLEATDAVPYTTPTGHNGIYLGNRSFKLTHSYNFNGQIAEAIIFNGEINDLERTLIDNYLAAKYGMSIVDDYYDYEGTHKFGLIALGDDGTNSQTTARGAGMLEISSPTDLGSDEYFLVAHTDFEPTEYNDVDVPAALAGSQQRMERTWRVDETGEVGTTTLKFFLGTEEYVDDPSGFSLLVDSDGIFTDATVIAGTYSAVENSLTYTVDLSDGNYFTIAGNLQANVIHSITSGPWSETTTWDCGCIPDEFDRVFIDLSTNVNVDTDAKVDFLRVELFGTLTMDTDNTLDIHGDWEIGGSTSLTDGTIELSGSADQDVSNQTVFPAEDVQFNNLTINNSGVGDVTFNDGTFSLAGTLQADQGNMVVDASTEFTITSTSVTEGGRVGPINALATISGAFNVQRFIPAGPANWRNLCSPVVGSTFDDWDPDIAMSGTGFPDGCAYDADGCFFSVTYTEDGVLTEVENSTDAILNGRGFELFLGTDLVDFDGATIVSEGTLNSSTDVMNSYGAGWSTVGNPYASPITFDGVTKGGGVGLYFYVFNPVTGAYEWYDETSGTSSTPEIGASGLIATGQGVWVFVTGSGSLTYSQSSKTSVDATFFREPGTISPILEVTLSENSSTYKCSIVLEELSEATDGIDPILDIRHLSTGDEKAPSFAVSSGDEYLRKNYIADNGRDKSFKLHSKVLNEGLHTISATNWADFRYYQKILLFDSKTGETVDLKNTDYVYFATMDKEDSERFTLILTNGENASENSSFASTDIDMGALKLTQMGHVINAQSEVDYGTPTTVTVSNILGQSEVFVTTTQLITGSNIITLPESLKGFYIITLRTGDEVVSQKIML